MMENVNLRNLFQKKMVIEKINYFGLFSSQIVQPTYPEGQAVLTIAKVKSESMYGKYSGNVKIEITFQDSDGNQLNQMFILKNGKNNNFGKFIYQVLGYEPQGEISLKDLEGKKVAATIFHYYNENGGGYANVAFCTREEN